MCFRKRLLFLAALAMGLSTSNVTPSAGAHASSEDSPDPGWKNSTPAPLALPRAGGLTELQKAYLDTYSILSQDNACSNFFGGPGAIDALNGLTQRLQPTFLGKDIAVRMKGKIETVTTTNGFWYRLFQKAEINLNGPFYQGNLLPGREIIPNIGKFSPNTREARVTVLLHELGHLVLTRNGSSLLPDDGDNPLISRENTERIIAVCGDRIRGLHNITLEEEFEALQSAQAPVSVARKD